MRRIVPSVGAAAVVGGSLVALLHTQAPAPPAAQAQVTFANDIQPMLEKSCWSCHSADLKLAQLDLSTREATLQGGAHGAVLVPGSAEKSKLYRMAAGLDQPKMPMQGDPLQPAQLAALKTWIDQGAVWETPVSFAKDIRPIFSNTCGTCHGDTAQLSKFDLRTRESALLGGERGSDIVPGNAEQSRLYRRVAGLEKPSMPLQGSPLTPAQVSAIKQWINDGAKWDLPASTSSSTSSGAPAAPSGAASAAVAALMERPITQAERDYWTFKLPVQAPPPVVANRNFVNPIDRFLEKTRAEHGVKAAPR